MSFYLFSENCPCFWCAQKRSRRAHPSTRHLPLADEVCICCGWENDSVIGEMCVRCVRQEEESMR